MGAPSTSQVNKAGRTLRKWGRGELLAVDEYERAHEILLAHRAAHRLPLTKATMGLRSMVFTEGCDVDVTQRLKRVPTIVGKLVREPTMQLANMQDISGCRAVLGSVGEVRRVQQRLSRNRPPTRVFDYIEEPRSSGYRGVHVVVAYDQRPVEVQLRTKAMHEWAVTVESLGGRLGRDLKSGDGPPQVLALLDVLSAVMAVEEEGGTSTGEDLDRLASLRRAAIPFLRGGRR